METTTVEAPGDRYRCACVHFDAGACLRWRYGLEFTGDGERQECCCICHHADQDEDDEL
jgi:hypothetical protein